MSSHRVTTFVEALREGIIQSLKKFPSLFLMGEGVNDPSSMWGTIKGIDKLFGKKRILEMPVAENGMFGLAVGSAIQGSRPLINLQRVEFALYAFEQIINNAAKSSYISRGKHKVPLVIRMVIGRGWGQGPEHAQSLENIFSSIPGLKVVMPCFPQDAKSLIISSIADNNPVVFLEHRWLHNSTGRVSNHFKIEKLKSFKKVHSGKDITIVASSINVLDAFKVIKFLNQNTNIKVDLLNLQVSNPLELNDFLRSVNKTKKLLTIDLGYKKFGISSELISSIYENGIQLVKPPLKLGLPFHPVPSSRGLVKNYYPSQVNILKSVLDLMNFNLKKRKFLISKFQTINKTIPIDVPDNFFKGPF